MGISHDILYNPLKSHCVVVPPWKGRQITPPSVFLNGNIIGHVDSVKYLGVFLINHSMNLRTLIGNFEVYMLVQTQYCLNLHIVRRLSNAAWLKRSV